MRGEVSIWRDGEEVFREDNMLCDGAGVLIADFMTVSPSLSLIEDHATSSILDASNYTIQAISFGTGEEAFQTNAHAMTEDKQDELIIAFSKFGNTDFSTSTVPAIVDLASGGSMEGSSYVPHVGLPDAPSPIPKVLQTGNTAPSEKIVVDVSSVFPGNGQLTNFLPSGMFSYATEGTPLSSMEDSYYTASLLGAFPEGSPNTSQMRIIQDGVDVVSVAPAYGYFNTASSMDLSGFVNMTMSSVPSNTYDMSSTTEGLCLSAAPTFAEDGIVEYSVTLAAGDVQFANAYGGIFHLGLWTIDRQASISQGNTPPFAFSVLNNPRKYRLFSRKGLSKSLTYISDNGTNEGNTNYSDLTIKWRIHFL